MSVNPHQYFINSIKIGVPKLEDLMVNLVSIEELQDKYEREGNKVALDNLVKALYCVPHIAEEKETNIGTLSTIDSKEECLSSIPTTTISTLEHEIKEQLTISSSSSQIQ